MTFCPTCEGLGEVSIKKKRMFPRKDFPDEIIIEEDTD
jgi:hypothetical protein